MIGVDAARAGADVDRSTVDFALGVARDAAGLGADALVEGVAPVAEELLVVDAGVELDDRGDDEAAGRLVGGDRDGEGLGIRGQRRVAGRLGGGLRRALERMAADGVRQQVEERWIDGDQRRRRGGDRCAAVGS